MEKSENGTVRSSISNGIGTIEFSHPQSNCLPAALLKGLTEAITAYGMEPLVKVIVLRSSGDKAFCAGASFDELLAIKNEEEGYRFFSGFAGLINAMRKCPKFVICRVQGKAVGGGVGMVAASDFCLATTTASIKLSELAVGIGPFVVGPAVERKIGISAMSQLTIQAADWQSAQWAQERGLYAHVYEGVSDMDDGISRLVSQLASSNPEAMAMLKTTFWRGTEDWDQLLADRAVLSGHLVLSDFTSQAIRSFKSR